MPLVCWSSVSLRFLKLSTVSTVLLLMRMGCWSDGVPITYFFCFPDIEIKVVTLTPLCEVCNTVIVQNRTVICVKSYKGSVVCSIWGRWLRSWCTHWCRACTRETGSEHILWKQGSWWTNASLWHARFYVNGFWLILWHANESMK